MKYAFIYLLILISLLYTFSYARHVWKANNKKAAVGAIILAIATLAAPAVIFIIKD